MDKVIHTRSYRLLGASSVSVGVGVVHKAHHCISGAQRSGWWFTCVALDVRSMLALIGDIGL